MSEKVSRRETLKILAGTVAGLVVGGAVGYYVGRTTAPTPPAEVEKPPEKPTAKPVKIKIGVIFPLTGAMAPLGQEEYFGVKTAIDIINERGGILGNKVEYVTADAKSDPSVGASEAERLITMEGVPIIVGHYSSAICLAVSEVCERYKVVDWSVGEVADKITQRGYKYILRPMPVAGCFGLTSLTFLKEVACPALGVDPEDLPVAIVHEDGPYGTSVAASNEAYAKKYGFPIVMKEGYSHKATDLSSLILKIKDANPEVLLITSYVSDAILFFKQAKELGLKVRLFIGHGGGHGVPATFEAVGEDVNYVFNIDPGTSPCAIDWSASTAEAREVTNEFIKRYRAHFNRDPLTHAGMAFAHAWVLLTDVLPRAVEKYGNVDPESILAAAQETDIPEGSIPCATHGVKFVKPGDTWKSPWGLEYTSGTNMRQFTVQYQWLENTLYCVYPEKYALKKAVVPLPPESPYAKG